MGSKWCFPATPGLPSRRFRHRSDLCILPADCRWTGAADPVFTNRCCKLVSDQFSAGRLVKPAGYYWLYLAEGHLNRRRFQAMHGRAARQEHTAAAPEYWRWLDHTITYTIFQKKCGLKPHRWPPSLGLFRLVVLLPTHGWTNSVIPEQTAIHHLGQADR